MDVVNEFVHQNSELIKEVGKGGEHPLEYLIINKENTRNHDIFKKYVELIDNQLDEFLKEEKLTADEVVESCLKIREMTEHSLYSVDYLLACIDFLGFYNMMIEYKVN